MRGQLSEEPLRVFTVHRGRLRGALNPYLSTNRANGRKNTSSGPPVWYPGMCLPGIVAFTKNAPANTNEHPIMYTHALISCLRYIFLFMNNSVEAQEATKIIGSIFLHMRVGISVTYDRMPVFLKRMKLSQNVYKIDFKLSD